MNTREKIKTIILLVLSITVIIFMWYIVIAWQSDYQKDLDRLKIITLEKKKNSDTWNVYQFQMEEEIKKVQAKRQNKQIKLELANDELRKEETEIQDRNLERLWLK